MTRAQILHLYELLERDNHYSYKLGVEYILETQDAKQEIPQEHALAYLTTFFYGLLAESKYEDAALFLWGDRMFNPDSRAAKLISSRMDTYDKLLCMGGGVQGKTWVPTVKVLLRWWEDPVYTTVKLVSTTDGHAKSNIFAGFVKLHREASIPLPGLIRENKIILDITNEFASIEKVSIQPGETGTAALRGFHRLHRKQIHPKFGDSSVIIVIVDEADNVPYGFWKGADNIASGRGEKGTIKIYAATNPMLRESEFASRAQPDLGWSGINKETTHEWNGQQGWHVIRLDVRQSENYKERREVFRNTMTYEAAKEYESKGINHPDYFTFILGLYPDSSAQYYVIPAVILENIKGTYTFVRQPFSCASFDPAFEEGGDRPILTAGRYGLANGYRSAAGKLETFPNKFVLQIEQQFELIKTENPLDMADNLVEMLKRLQVLPEWFVHDMTGNATLLNGYLLRKYGAVLGLKWGSAATEKKVFEEDTETAEEQFYGLISEMWISFSRWAQFGYVKIAPMMPTLDLFNEMAARKYEMASKTMMKVESKDNYKANNSGKSPDYSDSAIMLVHLCRLRGQDSQAMLAENQTYKPPTIPSDDWSSFDKKENQNDLRSMVIPFMKLDD